MTPRMPRRPLPESYAVKIIADSIGAHGIRLTTWALTYPRFVHAELMTHRVFSRNAASSRAIPSEKMRRMVAETPALPVWWGKNQSGMQAREELSDERPPQPPPYYVPGLGWDSMADIHWPLSPRGEAQRLWLQARDLMLEYSEKLAALGLHKQLCNRLTEPWMPITVLVSATTFANFFHQRDHKDAQPEIQVIATEMHYQYLEAKPRKLAVGEWHLPYITDEDYKDPIVAGGRHGSTHSIDVLMQVSVGRCARVSFLTHEGKRDAAKDIELHDRLAATADSEDPGHFSPFEHVAECLPDDFPSGNFKGWRQYRKSFENESGVHVRDITAPR